MAQQVSQPVKSHPGCEKGREDRQTGLTSVSPRPQEDFSGKETTLKRETESSLSLGAGSEQTDQQPLGVTPTSPRERGGDREDVPYPLPAHDIMGGVECNAQTLPTS